MSGPVWDQRLLDAMYAGAASYLHGHSVGGTNPSLLRAMVHGAPVIAFDCAYNRETTGGDATWFRSSSDVARAVAATEAAAEAEAEAEETRHDADDALSQLGDTYTWPAVVRAYDVLLSTLAG